MPIRRSYGSYDDGCAAAHALDLIGERWALLVVRELMLGPKRFTDLRAGVAGAGANVISQRLRELEAAGVLRRRWLGPPARASVYELTEWGLALEPVLQALGRWGARSPAMRHGAPITPDTVILSMRTMVDADAARKAHLAVELRLGSDRFRATTTGKQLVVERGGVENPDAVVTTQATAFARVLYYGRSLDDAIAAGDLRVDGDRRAVEALLALFPTLGTALSA